SMLPPLRETTKASTMGISGINHAASAPALLRFAFRVATHAQGWLPAGWAGLYREGVEPSGPLRKVSDHMTILLSCSPDAARATLRVLRGALAAGACEHASTCCSML